MYIEYKIARWEKLYLPDCITEEALIEPLSQESSPITIYNFLQDHLPSEEFNKWFNLLDKDTIAGFHYFIHSDNSNGLTTLEVKSDDDRLLWCNEDDYHDFVMDDNFL